MGKERARRVDRENYISKFENLNTEIMSEFYYVTALKRKNYCLAIDSRAHSRAIKDCERVLKNLNEMDTYTNKIIAFKESLSTLDPLSKKILFNYFVKLKSASELYPIMGICERTFYRRLNKACEVIVKNYENKVKGG